MKKLIVFILCLLIPSIIYAQKATELYIPIGQSPGLSRNLTVIGTIISIDPLNTTITVKSGEKAYRVKIKPRNGDGTWIYVDRSKQKKSNEYGYFNQFVLGELVEVKFEHNLIGQPAEWVKVER